MKISEQWLREWINPPVNTDQLAEQLTMAGLEVEAIEQVSIKFTGVVVAQVESVTSHPHADKLKVCQVHRGDGDSLTVVCGAENVRAGMRVPLAQLGAKLPGNRSITVTEIKGVKSEGMLCSALELGLVDESGGLLELPAETTLGQNLSGLLTPNDAVIELSITPNRGDCLSIVGLAREVSVLNNCLFKVPRIESVAAMNDRQTSVKLDAPESCPHYAGRIIENVDCTRPVPLWLIERLYRSGLRSINAVVDISNYVMLELGQPMHAFDNDKLQGSIHIRYARRGEKLVLLNNQEYTLSETTLVIADDTKSLAMAGIMGGLESAVTENSRAVFLESAFFNPRVILGQTRRYGFHTDSAHRFERGVDSTIQRQAVERATRLILDTCGGTPGPVIEASADKHLPVTQPISLHAKEIKRLLGITVDSTEVKRILECLGMQVKETGKNWKVKAPSWRFDIAIEADLIEEIARIRGYDAIPTEALYTSMCFNIGNRRHEQSRLICSVLVQRGYQEVITYSFVDKKLQEMITPDAKVLTLVNPIATDMSVMRTSLWPGLLQALQYNLKRQQMRGRLFEAGLVYRAGKTISQELMIGGIIYGNLYNKQWDRENISGDYFDVKGDIEGILVSCGCKQKTIEFRLATHPALHQGLSSEIFLENQSIGYAGALHPIIQMALELPLQAYVFELQVNRISQQITPKYRKISKFPCVRRDLAIVVADKVPVAKIVYCIRKSAPDMLNNLELFDVYQGEGIDLGKKSLALGLTFQKSSSTLTNEEVEATVGEILSRLRQEFGATLRE